MLITAHRESCNIEDKRDQHYLEDYSQFIPEGCEDSQGLYRHNTLKNDFMYRTLPDWEEDYTYEDWKDMTLNWIAEETGSKLTSIEEVREGRYWTLFHLQ